MQPCSGYCFGASMKALKLFLLMGAFILISPTSSGATSSLVKSQASDREQIKVSTGSVGNNDINWTRDQQHLKTVLTSLASDENKCIAIWDILWPWAKRGNLEARELLFSAVYPTAPDMISLELPGSAGDVLSRRRDAIILAVHTIGFHTGEESIDQNYESDSKHFYSAFLNDGGQGSAFLKCINTEPNNECAKRFVGILFPTFDRYAAQIDAFTKNGMKPRCVFPDEKRSSVEPR